MLEFVAGKADTPDLAPSFMGMLGSRFIAHPANQKIEIKVTALSHPPTTNCCGAVLPGDAASSNRQWIPELQQSLIA